MSVDKTNELSKKVYLKRREQFTGEKKRTIFLSKIKEIKKFSQKEIGSAPTNNETETAVRIFNENFFKKQPAPAR